MKKLFNLFALLLLNFVGNTQSAFLGTWEGKMNAGVELRMIFHISQDASNNYLVTIDCPEQGLKDVKANSVMLNTDSIRLEISQFGASYSGKKSSDSLITGTLVQGMSFPLNIKKITKVVVKNRPQTPVAPFPYKSEDIIYTNKDKSITYGATITIPSGKGPFPAALLLTGSGQQNRDEEILGHKPFAVIADHLTKNGFIVLRVDDRGVGQTTGKRFISTTRDFANDAIVGLNYLKNRNEVNKNMVGLIGHSEGGMIAQILAAERKDISFVVMLSGPGEKTMKVMNDQNEAMLLKSGMPKEFITSYMALYKNILNTVITSDSLSMKGNVKNVVNTWVEQTQPNAVVATTGIRDENSKTNFIDQFVSQVGHPWFKYFLSYDPAPYIRKMSAKVLALNGSKDIQVISKTNLQGIEAALKKSKSKSYEVKELEGLNHLFQDCKTCTVQEYDLIEQTISPKLLDTMTEWLKKSLLQ